MKLKVSYSILSAWQNGDRAYVLDALNGVYREPTEAMRIGTQYHKAFEEHVKETKTLPPEFGGGALIKPKTEIYKKKRLLEVGGEWKYEIWLSGVLDLQYGSNGEIICDYKTGTTRVGAYSGSLQTECYKVLAPEAMLFKYLHYDQYQKRAEDLIINVSGEEYYKQALASVTVTAFEILLWLKREVFRDRPDLFYAFDNTNNHAHKGDDE